MMAMFMAAVEGTIVATAVPTIVADLGGLRLFSWVFASYFLMQAVTIPLYGRLADVYGRRRTFFVGTGIFLTGSILCGFSRSMLALVLFRALQGLGAGGVQPIASTIVGDVFSATERSRVQGYLSAMWGLAAIIGPLLGAELITHFTWASIFWINVPIGIASIGLLAFFLRENIERAEHKIVGLRSLLVAAGIGGPIWRNRVIVIGNLASFAIGAISMAITAFMPTYVQGVMGRTPLIAGIVIGATAVSWTVGSIGAGRIMLRTSYRFATVLGGVMAVAGSAILVALQPQSGPLLAGAGTFVCGLGMGLTNTPLIVSIQSSVGWGQRGAATSSNMFSRQMGQALGTALFAAVFNLGMSARGIGAAAMAASLRDVYAIATLFAVAITVLCLALPRGLSPKHQVA